jgi:hypothetical protein
VSDQFEHEVEEVVGLDVTAGAGEGATPDADHARLRQAEHQAHEIAGAIYGTILATTVVAAIGSDPEKLTRSLAVVLVTSAVFYAAHVYSVVVGARMVARRHLTPAEVGVIAKAEWPMLQSSLPVALPLLLGKLGWISEENATDVAMIVGIGALFVYGVLIGIREGRGWLSVLVNALIVGSFGVLILLLKVLVH